MKSISCMLTVLGLVAAVAASAQPPQYDTSKVGDTGFVAFEGKQDWPVGQNAQVLTDYSIPIYLNLPNKPYTVIGRIVDTRQTGIDTVGRGFDQAFGKEKYRERDVANQARLHGADAVVVTDNDKFITALGMSARQVRDSAPLFKHEHSVVLAIKFR